MVDSVSANDVVENESVDVFDERTAAWTVLFIERN